MARADELLTAVKDIHDPHIATDMRRMSASAIQAVYVLLVNPYENIAPLLAEFDARKKA